MVLEPVWERLGGEEQHSREFFVCSLSTNVSCSIGRERPSRDGRWSLWTAKGRGDGWFFEKANFQSASRARAFAAEHAAVFAKAAQR